MVLGIGVDSVDIERFARFKDYNRLSLRKIFSDYEIDYCLSHEKKSEERFAARFAAKEAFYKAFCMVFPKIKISFFFFVRHCHLQHQDNGHVIFIVDWNFLIAQNLKESFFFPTIHVSLTHSKTIATALVVLEQ